MGNIGNIIPRIHINQLNVIVVLMPGEALVGCGGDGAVAAEGEVAGGCAALNNAVGLGQKTGAVKVVVVDIEQATVGRVAGDASSNGLSPGAVGVAGVGVLLLHGRLSQLIDFISW